MQNKKENNQKYILYGAGELGKLASQFFDFYNIKYILCEDTPQNENIFRIEDIIIEDNPLVIICISTTSYIEILNKLQNKGFNNIKSFFEVAEEINKANDYKHPLTNGWRKEKWKESEEIYCDKVAHNLNDEASIKQYYSFIHWHIYYTEFLYNQTINCNNRYFIPEITSVLHDHEVFVDVGTYDGRVIKKFIENIHSRFNSIYCFEPDLENCFNLSQSIGDIEFLYLYNIALGNKKGYVNFNNCKYLSKVDKRSKNKVPINKLDNIELTPTFIKYHLEGYELEAIKGSIKTIKKYRPIIAVTTYHTKEGLYKLPLYLIKNLKNYNFYWRNHNYMGQGAVIYCIPKERSK